MLVIIYARGWRELKCVKQWIKPLPSITGQDAFEMSKYVKLAYWEELKQAYKSFIDLCRSSKEVGVLFIVGEWGLGKTSSFKSLAAPYVHETGGTAYVIKARDLLNIYKTLNPSDYLSAERFIRASLITIIKAYNLDINTNASTKEIYGNLLKLNNSSYIILLIDEYESLISERLEETLELLDSLAGLVNGEYLPFSRKGEFAGTLLLAISLTPQALARFKSEISAQEIIGRSLRRVLRSIELRPLRRLEAYELFIGLLRYIYAGKLPKKIPLPTLSLIDTFYRVSGGNPGYFILIVNRLLSILLKRGCPNGYVKIASYEDVKDALKGILIEELGEERLDLIDENRISFYEDLITSEDPINGINVAKIFRALALSSFPLSLNEIKEMLQEEINVNLLHAERLIKKALGVLIRVPLLKFKPVNIKDVIRIISSFSSMVSKEELEKIRDFLEQYKKIKLSNSELRETYYLIPEDYETLEVLLEEAELRFGINYAVISNILTQLFELKSSHNEVFYKLNEDILDEVFPPICPICPASLSKSDALRIWRETLKEVSEGTVSAIELGKALSILIFPEIFESEMDYAEGMCYVKSIRYGNHDIRLRFIPIAVINNRDLYPEVFMRKFSEILKQAPLVFLFTKENLAPLAKNLASYLSNIYKIEILTLSTADMAVLYGLKKLVKEGLKINRDFIRRVLNNLRVKYRITHERIINLLYECQMAGILLIRLDWPHSPSLSVLPSVYDYFLAFPSATMDAKNVFEWVRDNIKGKMLHGRKSKEIPCGADIENYETLKKLENYLVRAGFLKALGERVIITNSPIESRLISLLKQLGEISINDIYRYFIFGREEEELAKTGKSLLHTIYIPILMRKGIIYSEKVKEGDEVREIIKLKELNELERESRLSIEQLEKRFLVSDEYWRKMSIIVSCKERGCRVISLSAVLDFLKSLYSVAINLKHDSDRRRILATIIRLSKHYSSTYFELITLAYKTSMELLSEMKTELIRIKRDLSKLNEHLLNLGLIFDAERLSEIQELERHIEEYEDLINKEFTQEEVIGILFDTRRGLNLNEVFDHKKIKTKHGKLDEASAARAFYLNPKLYMLKEVYNSFKQCAQEVKVEINKLNESVRRFDELDRMALEVRELMSKLLRSLKVKFAKTELLDNKTLVLRSMPISSLREGLEKLKELEMEVSKIRKFLEASRNTLRNILRIIKQTKDYMDEYLEIKAACDKRNLERDLCESLVSLWSDLWLKLNDMAKRLVNIKQFDELYKELQGCEQEITLIFIQFKKAFQSARETLNARYDSVKRLINECETIIKSITELEDRVEFLDIKTYRELLVKFDDVKKDFYVNENLLKCEKNLYSIRERFMRLLEKCTDPIERELSKKLTNITPGEDRNLISLILDIKKTTNRSLEEVIIKIMRKLIKLAEQGEVIVIIRRNE